MLKKFTTAISLLIIGGILALGGYGAYKINDKVEQINANHNDIINIGNWINQVSQPQAEVKE